MSTVVRPRLREVYGKAHPVRQKVLCLYPGPVCCGQSPDCREPDSAAPAFLAAGAVRPVKPLEEHFRGAVRQDRAGVFYPQLNPAILLAEGNPNLPAVPSVLHRVI